MLGTTILALGVLAVGSQGPPVSPVPTNGSTLATGRYRR